MGPVSPATSPSVLLGSLQRCPPAGIDACHPADSTRDKRRFALARKLALQRKKPAQGFSLGEKENKKNRLESKFPWFCFCFFFFFALGESFSHAPLESVQGANVPWFP